MKQFPCFFHEAIHCFFESKDKAAFKTEAFQPELTGKQVLVKADFDLISAGTELANYHHLPNTVTAEHGFPHYPGYSVSGHGVAVGPEAKQLKPGDNVVVHWGGHRSYFVYEESNLFKVPAGIDPKIAACAHLASFAFLGVRKLELQLGEAVMIAGLGLLGQFAVQITRQSGGCPVLACDFSPERGAKVVMSSHMSIPRTGEKVLAHLREQASRRADILKIVTGAYTEAEMLEAMRTTMLLNRELEKPYIHLCNGVYSRPHRFMGLHSWGTR